MSHRFFTASGRANRAVYGAHVAAAVLLALVTLAPLAPIKGTPSPSNAPLAWLSGLVCSAAWASARLRSVERAHDIGWSGWTCLLLALPLVGLAWLCKAGDPRANRFDAPPPASTKTASWAVGMSIGSVATLVVLAWMVLHALPMMHTD